MANRRCPSCGQSYNGKRCKNCFYEPFGDVRPSFELHPVRPPVPHREPPLRPVPRKQPKKSSPGKAILQRLGILWAVMLVTTVILPMVFEVFENVGSSFEVAAPEPIPLPADGIVLYEDADIQVIADWDGTPIDSDIPIFVQNFTGKDLTVCTDGVAVNGCMVEDVFFYCDAYRNSVSKAALWVDLETLGNMGIKEGQYLQMAIDVMDEDFRILVDNAMVTIGTPYTQDLDVSGTILYENNGILFAYLGAEKDQYDRAILNFYAENNTANILEMYSEELLLDQEGTGCYLWQNFFPGTKAILRAYLNEELPSDPVSAQLELYMAPNYDWDQEIRTNVIHFQVN